MMFEQIINCIDILKCLKIVFDKLFSNKTFENLLVLLHELGFFDIFAQVENFLSRENSTEINIILSIFFWLK